MKAAKWIVLFLVFFNGGGVLVAESGIDDYLGIAPGTGSNPQLESAQGQLNSDAGDRQSTDSGTLFGFYSATSDAFGALVNAINPGAAQLKAALPYPTLHLVIDFVFAGANLVAGITVIQFLRSGGGV
jgi:hypothetical protein